MASLLGRGIAWVVSPSNVCRDGISPYALHLQDLLLCWFLLLFIGATSINQGVFIQETPEWLQDLVGGPDILSTEEITAAYDWVSSY